VTRPLLPHERDRRLGHVDDAEEIGLDLGPELSEACVLDRADIAIARIVDENIQPSEGFGSCLDGTVCCLLIGDVECDGANLFAVALRQIGKLRGIARRQCWSGANRFSVRCRLVHARILLAAVSLDASRS